MGRLRPPYALGPPSSEARPGELQTAQGVLLRPRQEVLPWFSHHIGGALLPTGGMGATRLRPTGNCRGRGGGHQPPPSRRKPRNPRKKGRAPTHHFGLEGWLDLAVLQLLPVDPPEEGMLPHVPLALGPAAQPLPGVLGHQLEAGEKEALAWDRATRGLPCSSGLCTDPR